MNSQTNSNLVHISSTKFILSCSIAAILIFLLGTFYTFPTYLVAIEVFATVISLFVFGSAKYRIDKNAVTYGMVLIIFATFWSAWWKQSMLHQAMQSEGGSALWHFLSHYLLTLHGLDELFHADTMLFILGLTLFVAVIAQTRLLESVSFKVLEKNKGLVVPTVAALAAVVAFSSGILDGVSMIGLMIRILVMILFLAKAKDEAVIYAVMVSTVVTTVCGMWLAYGEPPNLIMKANLHPHLDNSFFLRYCAPAAIGSYFIVFWNIRKRLKGKKVNTKKLDILDRHTADVRFLQASRHGKVLTPTEFVNDYQKLLGDHYVEVEKRLHRGEPLGLALVQENVPVPIRHELLGHFVDEKLAPNLDQHYQQMAANNLSEQNSSEQRIAKTLRTMRRQRVKTQWFGTLAFFPFVGFLVWHAIDHEFPLFYASFAGFIVAFLGIMKIPKMRKLALHEARHEYNEYLFLFPLFFSITLLQKTGFFSHISTFLHEGIDRWGPTHLAYMQFAGTSFLSAILDNNVVADFISRALLGLEISVLHLFSMAQIAGYATGGCWTHIGSAQAVVAYAFIRREINSNFTPFNWIKAMTPIIIEIFILMTLIVYGEAYLLKYFPEH